MENKVIFESESEFDKIRNVVPRTIFSIYQTTGYFSN